MALYVLALLAWLAGIFGWFGIGQDPLSGIFLVPLGLPWNRFVDLLPQQTWPWAAAAAPLVNLLLIAGLCRFFERRG
jgi:hypothetical protein